MHPLLQAALRGDPGPVPDAVGSDSMLRDLWAAYDIAQRLDDEELTRHCLLSLERRFYALVPLRAGDMPEDVICSSIAEALNPSIGADVENLYTALGDFELCCNELREHLGYYYDARPAGNGNFAVLRRELEAIAKAARDTVNRVADRLMGRDDD